MQFPKQYMSVDPISFLIVYPAIMLIGSIGITPAGLGVAELGWVGLLTFLGVGAGMAALYAIVKKVLDDFNLFVSFAIGYGYYYLNNKSRIQPTADNS